MLFLSCSCGLESWFQPIYCNIGQTIIYFDSADLVADKAYNFLGSWVWRLEWAVNSCLLLDLSLQWFVARAGLKECKMLRRCCTKAWVFGDAPVDVSSCPGIFKAVSYTSSATEQSRSLHAILRPNMTIGKTSTHFSVLCAIIFLLSCCSNAQSYHLIAVGRKLFNIAWYPGGLKVQLIKLLQTVAPGL